VHFNAWQTTHFTAQERADPLVGGALANPDGDPYLNWQEYAHGLDPHTADEAIFRSGVISDAGEDHLGGMVRRRSFAADLQWSLEVSTDGIDWITVPDAVGEALASHGNGTETVTMREGAVAGGVPAKRARMRVGFTP
jgi:hypothetical protein